MITQQAYGDIFSETATHGTAAVATKAGATGKTHYITDITVSSDKAGAICLVKKGTTTIWQFQVGTTAAGLQSQPISFGTPLKGDLGGLVSVEIDGTSACKANMSGFTI